MMIKLQCEVNSLDFRGTIAKIDMFSLNVGSSMLKWGFLWI